MTDSAILLSRMNSRLCKAHCRLIVRQNTPSRKIIYTNRATRLDTRTFWEKMGKQS